MQPVAQQIGLNSPPALPADGQCWLVGGTPTGAWTGQANRLAQRIGGAWVFHAPSVGLVVFDAATLSQRAWGGSASTLLAPRLLEGSASHDPPNLAAGEGLTTTVTVAGASLGDCVRANFSGDLQGIMLTAWVPAAGTVSIRFHNGTAASIDLASGTLRVRAENCSRHRNAMIMTVARSAAVTHRLPPNRA